MADYWSSFQLDGRRLSVNVHGESSHRSAGLHPCTLARFLLRRPANMMSLNTTHAHNCANSLVDAIILWALMFLCFLLWLFLVASQLLCPRWHHSNAKLKYISREGRFNPGHREYLGIDLSLQKTSKQIETMVHYGNCRIHLASRTYSGDNRMLFLCLGCCDWKKIHKSSYLLNFRLSWSYCVLATYFKTSWSFSTTITTTMKGWTPGWNNSSEIKSRATRGEGLNILWKCWDSKWSQI